MTTDKDFKRLVRGRMRKTGESYTTARAQLLKQGSRGDAAATAAVSPAHRAPSPAAGAADPSGASGATRTRTTMATKPKATAARPIRARATPAEETPVKATPAKTTPANANSARRGSRTDETEYARLAGRSETAVKAATGCSWERWVKALDHAGAQAWSHARIARYVHERYKIPGWWAQGVAVGYERIKGLRAIGQRRDGRYEINRSRTVAAPLARLYAAFHRPELRTRWLDVPVTIRSATEGKWMRITWPDGTSVSVGFTAKGEDKSQVALSHEKLPDQATADERRQYWGARLEALSGLLTG